MQALKKIYLSLILKLSIAFGIFMIFRILFVVFNASYFSDISLLNFWGGLRFDWMTICLLYLPFILGHLIDVKGKSRVLAILFHLSNTVAILFNALDLEYYKFTFKRTTADLFLTDGLGKDLSNLGFTFIVDFWYLIVIAGLLIWLSAKAYKRTNKIETTWPGWRLYLAFLLPVLVFLGLGVRGGAQFKPLKVISAGQYAKAANIPIVLNTPFTVIKSAYKEGLSQKHFFEPSELSSVFNPQLSFKADTLAHPKNVVLIIAESFSKEYIGAFAPPGYTPYLDTLISQSLVFENAFANGKKSIEALPAILSSIPSLANTPYISGKYGSNRISSLGTVMNKSGFNTSFYHGGENGTMGFNSFTQIAGIEQYNGRDQYPYDYGYDGVWGIFDLPYLNYVREDINEKEEPFFTGIFTLSSHHPYAVPAEFKDRFTEGPLPILKSVEYADYALHEFMEAAKKEPWFDETLFVITADHTSQALTPFGLTRVGMYRVPLIFYAPNYIESAMKSDIVQHVDILPSIVDFMGLEAEFISYGNSVFRDSDDRYSVNYIQNVFQIVGPKYCLTFDGENPVGFYDYASDPAFVDNLLGKGIPEEELMTNRLKGIIQDYNQRLIENALYVEQQ